MGKKIISSQGLDQVQVYSPNRSLKTPDQEGEKDLEREWQDKVNQAYQKGFEEGLAKGLSKVDEEVKRLNAWLKQLSEEKTQLYKDAERELVELAIAIAERIVGAITEKDKGKVLGIVKRAVEALSDKSEVIIYVSFQDEAFLLEAKDKILEGVEGKIKIIPDASVPEGGCIVQGKTGRIDALLSSQLEEIRKRLLE